MSLTYAPDIFDAADLDAAKAIILTPEPDGGPTTAERWEHETAYLMGLIDTHLDLDVTSLVLDYGCGVGRMSKALIERYGCFVCGVDANDEMKRMAKAYVNSGRFGTIRSDKVNEWAAGSENTVDAAISIWVLQHCVNPAEDIDRMARALKPGGRGFVVNHDLRLIPARNEAGEWMWVQDGVDVYALLHQAFRVDGYGRLDPTQGGNPGLSQAWWCSFTKREG